jgi:hypothetical protein
MNVRPSDLAAFVTDESQPALGWRGRAPLLLPLQHGVPTSPAPYTLASQRLV